MQCNTSFVVLDPKGELLRDTGYLLEKEGYIIKVVDLINMSKSHCYNPFEYIKDDKDVLKLITNLIRNTTPKKAVAESDLVSPAKSCAFQEEALRYYERKRQRLF